MSNRCRTAVGVLMVFCISTMGPWGCGYAEIGGGADPRELNDDDLTGFSLSGSSACPGANQVKGVDVSSWDPNVDWDKVIKDGQKFAFLRISYGYKYKDKLFDGYWKQLKEKGLMRGGYQFFLPSQDAKKQADLVVQKLGKLGKYDLPAVLDLEDLQGVYKKTVVKMMKTWIDIVTKGTGKRPIIYTNWGTWGSLGDPTDFSHLPLWVASYMRKCPRMPESWSGWSIWQHADTGRVPGIPGNADVNIFNGTMAQLEALATSAASLYAPPPKPQGKADAGVPPPKDSGSPPPPKKDASVPPKKDAGPPSSAGCHQGAPFGWLYCSASCPCKTGQGDCDKDSECNPGLICASNVGSKYGVGNTVDVCEKPASSSSTGSSCHPGALFGWLYCSASCPCKAGEGDCDSDSECNPGLTCASNVGSKYGVNYTIDVCQAP